MIHVTHLGHILANDLDDSQELNRIARAFNRQFNAFFNRFGEIQNTELKKYLFTSFCASYYGIEIINPKNVSVPALKFWRKSINLAMIKLLQLPRESVSQYLIAEGILNADSVWSYRSLIFWKNLSSGTPATNPLIACNEEFLETLRNDLSISLNLESASKVQIKDTVIVQWALKKNLC